MIGSVNGKPVEYMSVKETENGFEVVYSPVFNLAISTVEETLERLNKHGIWVHTIIRREEYGCVLIYPFNREDNVKILELLNIPKYARRIGRDGIITVFIDKLLEDLYDTEI